MTIRPGIRNRWTTWRRISTHPGIYPSCQHTTGTEPCCCERDDCYDGGRWNTHCGRRISLTRYLLAGVCDDHKQGQP